MRRLLVLFAAIAAVVTLLAVASPTGATEAEKFTTNFYFNCRPDHNIGVPVGHVLVLRFGWAAQTRGLVETFLQGHDMTALIDGVPIAEPEQYWGDPVRAPDGTWVARWVYDTGIAVTPEHPFTIEIAGIATHPIHDGIVLAGDHDSRPALAEPGQSLFDSDGPCSVTAF